MSEHETNTMENRASAIRRSFKIPKKDRCPYCADFIFICKANKRELLAFGKERELSLEMDDFLRSHEKLEVA